MFQQLNRSTRTLRLLPFMTLLLALLLTCVAPACHKKTSSSTPIPNAVNTFDGDTYRVLMDAQAAINSFKNDVESGKVKETPVVKTALNQAIADYNALNQLWQAYHASQGTTPPQAQITAATAQLNSDVTSLANLSSTGAKQ